MPSTRRPRVFLDVSIGESPTGRLVIELFADQTPRTCENFRQLCTGEYKGLTYTKTPFHRIIDEFMIQGGDIAKGDGKGVISIYGQEFDDENLSWRKLDAAGLVCAANRGKDTNGSQFFITLEPCEYLNGKHTIFGHLVSGEDTLQRIAKVETDKDDRPLEPVLISRCGELEKRKKAVPVSHRDVVAESRDRGRRQRNHDSDVEMENSPEPKKPHKHRRQSDNMVDEGIRGRPRQRSGSRSPSRPLSTNDESEESDRSSSGPRRHKRKRSPSPSRHSKNATHERRRRSLPNQYGDQRYMAASDEEEKQWANARAEDPARYGRKRPHHDSGRRDDRYRPARDRNPHGDDGRLGVGGGGGGGYDDYDPPVKFKGRGVMKYRELERQW